MEHEVRGGSAFALHTAHPSWIPGIPYVPPSIARSTHSHTHTNTHTHTHIYLYISSQPTYNINNATKKLTNSCFQPTFSDRYWQCAELSCGYVLPAPCSHSQGSTWGTGDRTQVATCKARAIVCVLSL